MNTNLILKPPMQNGTITIDQLAVYLGWSTRTIMKLVRDAHLPTIEMDGKKIFRLNEVLDWVEQNMSIIDRPQVSEWEAKMESSLLEDGIFRTTRTDRLTSRLPVTGIALDVPLTNKSEIIRGIGSLASNTGLLYDRNQLIASLMDREALCSTAMPGGVALCHPRRPIPLIIERQFLCFLRTASPVDFEAEDGSDTSLFFLLCTPDDRSHLHGLARLARILHGDTLELLRSAATPEELLAVLADAESKIQTKA
jgi:PTS system nitrogen regulatory IIA component